MPIKCRDGKLPSNIRVTVVYPDLRCTETLDNCDAEKAVSQESHTPKTVHEPFTSVSSSHSPALVDQNEYLFNQLSLLARECEQPNTEQIFCERPAMTLLEHLEEEMHAR
jgi:hypothetical protein